MTGLTCAVNMPRASISPGPVPIRVSKVVHRTRGPQRGTTEDAREKLVDGRWRTTGIWWTCGFVPIGTINNG